MNRITGTFKQQNAAVYIGLGFIPDWVQLKSLTTDTKILLDWSVNMRTLDANEGLLRTGDDDEAFDIADLGAGEGIKIYRGGDIITSATTPSTTTYLAKDSSPDKRASGTGDTINKWTLGSATNKTGNWNDVCNTSYVGVGSRICVDGKWATVTALTSNGEQANEVTLNEALPSGTIQMLTGIYDFIAQASGTITKAGFLCADKTYLLDSTTDYIMFEAGTYA
mgnify:CR=1 FL=1